MISSIISFLSLIITGTIDSLGYFGVGLLMALESCNIPIPSEVILPYAGFLASGGLLNIHLAAFAGAVGGLIGSVASYWLGKRLGRPFLWKYGRWFLISRHDLELSEKVLDRLDGAGYFLSRLLPVIRTFISFIAGVTRAEFWQFCFSSFFGSWLWSYLLVYVGLKLGDNWQHIGPWWDRFHELIGGLIIAGIICHVIRSLRKPKEKKS
jgi:membrane protein DedA with SNARE-associated domain